MKGLVVVPAFNEEKIIASVLAKIPKKVKGHLLDTLVVDDGSTDNTKELVKRVGIKTISHPINRGLGAALETGFEYARVNNFDFLITLDADGQHDPDELYKIIEPILSGEADFVIGTRFLRKGMPKSRLLITFLASVATYAFTSVWTTDSQSGFRAFSKRAINQMKIEVDRMEVASEFFRLAKENNLKFTEVPITPIYTRYSLKKGQNFFNSANIVGKLFLQRLIR